MKYQKERLSIGDAECDDLIYNTLYNRCEFVLEMAKVNNATNLILGAFGCGVFGCNPSVVANIFANLLCDKYEGVFKEVRFAIPKGPNNDAFHEVFVTF